MTERTLLQEAQNPRTSTARLREVYREAYRASSHADVAEAVAAHPNATPYLLERLTGECPRAVLRNPALPLVFQRDPKWPQGYQRDVALTLMRFENVPLPLLYAFAEKPDMVGSSARQHIGLAGEAGPDWEADAREALWELSGLEEEFPASLLPLDMVPDWLLESLAGHKDARVRRAAARHPRTPPDVLTLLRRAGSTSDLGGLAPPDLSLPAPLLTWLARGGSWARRVAARHPNTPPEILEWLADHRLGRTKQEKKDKTLCRYLMQNPAMPAARLAALAAEFDAEFRRTSARDPETPPLVLAALSIDEARDVRWMAARNPNTPREALEVLAGDTDARVRQGVGRNTAAFPALLARLAADPVRWVRLAAARHPQTPSSILEWLAEDDDEEVRQSVARRTQSAPPAPRPPKPPRSVPEAVPKQAVPKQAVPPADPDARLKALGLAIQSGGLRGGLLTHLVALACPDTPLPVLLAGAADPRWPRRLAVARNPAAFLLSLGMPGTDADLHALAHDGNRLVRAAAREALQKMEEGKMEGSA